jgi:hypothetical protein
MKKLGKFVETIQLEKKKKSLEQKVSSVIAIVGIDASLFFLGSSVTGNAIVNLSKSSSNFVGVILLSIGLINVFFCLKNRKNKFAKKDLKEISRV